MVAYYSITNEGLYLVPQGFYDVNVCVFDQEISVYSSEEELQEDMPELEERYGDFDDFEEIIDCYKLGIATRKAGLREIAECLFETTDDIEVVKAKMQALGWTLKEEKVLFDDYDDYDEFDDYDDLDDYDDFEDDIDD